MNHDLLGSLRAIYYETAPGAINNAITVKFHVEVFVFRFSVSNSHGDDFTNCLCIEKRDRHQ